MTNEEILDKEYADIIDAMMAMEYELWLSNFNSESEV